MSLYKSRAQGRTWQKGKAASRRHPGPSEAEAKEIRLAAARLAVMLGWCTSCGVSVDEKNGKLHDPWCPDVPEERRMPR